MNGDGLADYRKNIGLVFISNLADDIRKILLF